MANKFKITLVISFILVLSNRSVYSVTKCDSLKGDKKELAENIMSENYLYDCCDETIEKCLNKKPRCRLAVRLSNEICGRVLEGRDRNEIESALSRRAKSMMPSTKLMQIDTSSIDTWAGDPESKVTLVAYLCAGCPFCSIITPEIYREVTEGRLKGKAKFHVRPFPIKGHPGSVEGALAMAAASKKGKFWPYLLNLYSKFEDYKVDRLVPWAKELGMDKDEFKAIMEAEETKELILESKKEGLRNGVDSTPTLFINGRRYYGDFNIEYLVDILEEEYDRITDQIYKK